MRANQFLLPLAVLLSVSAPLISPAASPAGSGWIERHKLTASDATAREVFGHSVAISGDTAIVGAPTALDPFGIVDAGGSAYLFDVTTGNEVYKLTASDAESDDYFGSSVAISGNIAIVGAYADDDGGTDSGSAYLFDVATGDELYKLTASDARSGDRFGLSVAISGDKAIVGTSASGTDGAAYLFDVATGNELDKLTASDAESGAYFG
ncbi:MAG: FG-GAP repeat protein, partial [Candidatus Nealsonbacteria bacterium]|nr:FG-GAP repeat protein [Candidatus Nealsonbacteria bacterium]